MLGEGRARLPFLPPFLPPRHPPLPPRVPDDDARARNNAKGRSKGPSKEHRGCSAHFPITRDVPGGGHCVPPPLARTHGAVPAPRSPQLPEGDVLVEAQAVVPLLLRHVAPLLPARNEPLWHHRPPPNPLHPPLHVTKGTGTPPGPLAAGARPMLDGLRCARLHPTC